MTNKKQTLMPSLLSIIAAAALGLAVTACTDRRGEQEPGTTGDMQQPDAQSSPSTPDSLNP